MLLAAIFVASGLLIANAHADTADAVRDGRLVTIHDRGNTRVVLTSAQTVRDALKSADISVIKTDNVEPALDSKLVAKSYVVNVYRSRPVVIHDGDASYKVITARQSAREIARDSGLELHEEDRVALGLSSDITTDGAGEILTIDRAIQFELTLYGKTMTAYSHAVTVGQMLRAKGIKLTQNDTLSVAKNTTLEPGMNVAIWRNGVQAVNLEEQVAFGTREIKDYDRPLGYRSVTTPGQDGTRNVVYEVTMRNGIEVSRKEIQSVQTKKPVEEVVTIGMAPPAGSHQDWLAAAGIAPSDFGYATYIVDHENASWHPCRAQGPGMIINCDYSGSLGYGLVQATPGNKMASAGSDWRTNPITQLKWANSYAVGRYGSWQAAYTFKVQNGWW